VSNVASAAGEEFRIGVVFSQSFSILFKNIVPFGLLYLAVNACSSLYALFLSANGNTTPDEDVVVGLLGLAEIFLGIVATAAITYATVQELRGRRVTIGEFLRRGLAQAGTVVLVAILSSVLLLLGFIAFVIPGIILYAMWWVAIPVAVIERPGTMASLRRSAALTAGYRWRLFGLILCFFLATGIVNSLIEGSGSTGVYFTTESESHPVGPAAIVASWLWTALLTAGQAVLTAVSYYQLRIAKEGVGIDEIAAVFD